VGRWGEPQKLKDTGSYLKGVWQRLNGGGGGDGESLVDLPAPQTTQKAEAQARQVSAILSDSHPLVS